MSRDKTRSVVAQLMQSEGVERPQTPPSPPHAAGEPAPGPGQINDREALLARIAELEHELKTQKIAYDLSEQARMGSEEQLNSLRAARKDTSVPLRRVVLPYKEEPWDILSGKAENTQIQRPSEVTSILTRLSRIVEDTTEFTGGADQTHVYNLAVLAIAALPDLESRFANKIAMKAHLVKRTNKRPVYDALWDAIIESMEGIKLAK